jgi:uncharacterized protein YbjT (DUF2867 family)
MKILVAGTGVLGKALIDVLFKKDIDIVGLAYRECEFKGIENKLIKALCCDITKPRQLEGILNGIDIVISTVGITRIKSNLTHMEVDYQGNLNLLREAENSKVKKFVFISPTGVDKGNKYVPLFKAKYMFEEKLKSSRINWIIFRAGAFFKDLAEMGKYAQKDKIFIVAKGNTKFTPIDVEELAKIMVEDTLKVNNQIIEVGGPEDMSWRDIWNCCFITLGKRPKVISLPVWLCKIIAWFIRPFSLQYYSLAKLLIFTSCEDLPTPRRGRKTFLNYLKNYYSKMTSYENRGIPKST